MTNQGSCQTKQDRAAQETSRVGHHSSMTINGNLRLITCICSNSSISFGQYFTLRRIHTVTTKTTHPYDSPCGHTLSPWHCSPAWPCTWQPLRVYFQFVILRHRLDAEIGLWMLPARIHRNSKIALPKTDGERLLLCLAKRYREGYSTSSAPRE